MTHFLTATALALCAVLPMRGAAGQALPDAGIETDEVPAVVEPVPDSLLNLLT